MVNDKVINHVGEIIDRCAQPLKLEVMSIVLYGARAKGNHSSQSSYDILILLSDNTCLKTYIKFIETIRLELLKEKLFNVKIICYTPETFEEILYNDNMAGAFLYMICRENIILLDKKGTFALIKERLASGALKDEEIFMKQCIEFCRIFGSEKWERKWEKILMQYKYLKNRREP
jgi:predicted nucleotidyltransferase